MTTITNFKELVPKTLYKIKTSIESYYMVPSDKNANNIDFTTKKRIYCNKPGDVFLFLFLKTKTNKYDKNGTEYIPVFYHINNNEFMCMPYFFDSNNPELFFEEI